MRVGQGEGDYQCFLFSMDLNPLLSWSLNFFGNFAKFMFMGFCVIAARGLIVYQSLCGENKFIVCSLFNIFIISIIISSVSSISIFFVALSNCLYLNPQVSPFCPFLLPISLWGDGVEGKKIGAQGAVYCLVASCQDKQQQK